MNALHHDHDGASTLIIEPRKSSVQEPIVCGVPLHMGKGIDSLKRVINDFDITASTCQCASSRGCEPEAAARQLDLGLAVLVATDARSREDRPIPGSAEQG